MPRYRVMLADEAQSVEIAEADGALRVRLGAGGWAEVQLRRDRGALWLVGVGDETFEALVEVQGDRVFVVLDGAAFEARVEDERLAQLARLAGAAGPTSAEQTIRAPMPGLVLKVNVEPGQAVAKGTCLAVIQAMKMENEILLPATGTVRTVAVRPGQTVEQGQLLVVVGP